MRSSVEAGAGDDLARLFEPAGRDDRALLDRFRRDGDGRAFEGLVVRHGPMVLGVCRRALGDAHDADDAFQATFLVLARRARSVRDADRLGPWLFGVARRVSAKARARKARRRERPAVAPESWPDRPGPAGDLVDVPAILDEELARVPAKLRSVLVLCLLEGHTAEEAAGRLGCPVGTAKSRLARGRAALRSRLEGRGVAPDAGLALLATPAASRVPLTLIRATLGVLAGGSAAVAPGVAALARGVAPAMIVKSTAGLLLAGLALVAGVPSSPSNPGPESPPATPQAPSPGPGAASLPDVPAPPPDAARNAARWESLNHLKTIMLALMNYEALHHHYPPTLFGTEGHARLSWRVAILPHLGEQKLYNEFHLDEPWDSPHNEALIPRMPKVFQTPDTPAAENTTLFLAITGHDAIFDGVRPVRPAEVTDNPGNTVMIAKAQASVTWTRPIEIEVGPLGPGLGEIGSMLDRLDDRDPAGCLVGMGDGSANYLPLDKQWLWRAVVTRSGGEVIDWSAALDLRVPRNVFPKDPAGAEPPRSPAAAAPPTVDDRLRVLEEKVDLLIRKLDAGPGAGRR